MGRKTIEITLYFEYGGNEPRACWSSVWHESDGQRRWIGSTGTSDSLDLTIEYAKFLARSACAAEEFQDVRDKL